MGLPEMKAKCSLLSAVPRTVDSEPAHLSSGLELSTKSDEELVLLCRKKDAAAFEVLVKRHERSIYNQLHQLAPEWNTVPDLCQEVFIRAWHRLPGLRDPRALRSWLNHIATNLFFDELRKRPKCVQIVSMDEPPSAEDQDEGTTRDIADTSALPDECFQRKELAQVINMAICELPEQFRTAIVLREINGLSYQSIARLTGTEMGTVKSRIARARLAVQHRLAPYLISSDLVPQHTASGHNHRQASLPVLPRQAVD